MDIDCLITSAYKRLAIWASRYKKHADRDFMSKQWENKFVFCLVMSSLIYSNSESNVDKIILKDFLNFCSYSLNCGIK